MIDDMVAHRGKQGCVVALHCSLGSGRQWTALADTLGSHYRVIAPDIAGYGESARVVHKQATLASEVHFLREHLRAAKGPIHLVGHSYGGAIAFKIATSEQYASRVRSLTLIEPVLPAVLLEHDADRPLYDYFSGIARRVCVDLWNGDRAAALDKFLRFWNGVEGAAAVPQDARARMLKYTDKLVGDFTAAFAEKNLGAAVLGIDVPTLLVSGGQSPDATQRIVGRLESMIADTRVKHLPGAGHMLAITHSDVINSEIVRLIVEADRPTERVSRPPLAAEPALV